jgi:hypothetical protein
MIWISTTQSKAVFVTLREKATLPNPYYTWQITNRDSLVETIFAPENFSGSPYYDCFTISVGTPSFATGSNVVLDIVQGQYDYKVFETGTEYNLSMTGSVVEIGILQVTGTATSIQQFTQSDDDTIKIFNYI